MRLNKPNLEGSIMNNLQRAVRIELPKILDQLRDKMANAKTRAEYLDAETLYLFLTENTESN
jgi:hypothetical protein